MNSNFCLPDKDGKEVCLNDFRGKFVIVYFYPKDDTTGCTIEAIDFTKNASELKKLNAEVVGISPDSGKSHCDFVDRYDLKVILLSDEKKAVIEKFGVWGKKNNYGKEYYGVIRSTFLISPEGKIVKEWRNVKAPGHVDEILKYLRSVNDNKI